MVVGLQFTDEKLDPVELKPSWTKEKEFQDSSAQSDPIETNNVEVQSTDSKDVGIQTDVQLSKEVKFIEDNSTELLDFLKRVVPDVCKQLDKNIRSHAFDGYEANWGAGPLPSQNIFSLKYAAVSRNFQVTSVTWSSTGSVLAISYGKHNHLDLCTDPAFLCTWNIDRRQVDTTKPDHVIDLECCLMELSFHPKHQNIIAGGAFNGEISVWDLSKEDDMLVASTGMIDSHREPISKITWVPDDKTLHSGKVVYNVITCSGDGKILMWKKSSRGDKNMELIKGFCILAESLPRTMRTLKTKRDAEIGITSLSFVFDDPSTFIVATEPGCLFKCNTDFQGTPAPKSMQSKISLYSPVTFTYQPHSATVYSVHCSPFHRKLFVSASADMSIRLYNNLETKPMISIEPNAGYLFSAQWSPFRPLVFSVTSATGILLLYDLQESRVAATHRLEVCSSKKPINVVEFNPEQRRLLAVGDGDGVAQVFQLSDELTSPISGEVGHLAALMEEISGE